MKLIILNLFLYTASFCDNTNIVFNPGFDMTPWDTGWIKEIDYYIVGSGGATITTNNGHSLPNCAYLYISLWKDIGVSEWADLKLKQEFHPITTCSVSVYVKYYVFTYPWDIAVIQISAKKINNQRIVLWEINGYGVDSVNWVHLNFQLTDTIKEIIFSAYSLVVSQTGTTAYIQFWVDDVYISGEQVGVSENYNYKEVIKAFPNPFADKVIFHYDFIPEEIKIYDISGKLIKIINKNYWDGTNKRNEIVSRGVYILKILYHNKEITKPIIFVRK